MNKYLCIHGHFYQPPRENPWLEAIENQGSAKPYHDWNERISEECYAPNAEARILNAERKITEITNNYSKISFNFGPTLLSWIQYKNPKLLQAILDADQTSQERFGGHGNAIAQAYNHMILPLANSRDKYTQLYWGIKDFEYYFNRKPEGLWLPETAVDLETLDMMSELGIQYTILAPNQLKQIKSFDGSDWQNEFSIGTPYLQKLPSGREITLFFYDGGVAKAVAFERLLTQGEHFAHRLLDSFPSEYTENTLMHIATDGETYGHHHPYGDMGLAYALNYIEENSDVQLTNYAQFMEIQPPEFEVEIHENSSWSCAHGVERWRSNCGCNNGKGWHQEWRGPLREALDWLRDKLIPVFEKSVRGLVKDPWDARNDYIDVLHDRTLLDDFVKRHEKKSLNTEEKKTLIKWMELQRHAMLMYTSCGWFFDELSGIETIQVIKYAARVIQLAFELTHKDYEKEFIEKLALAPSNIAEYENGAKLYYKWVKPQCIDLYKVSAHLAASLPFTKYEEKNQIYCYEALLKNTNTAVAGKEQLITGKFLITSQITLDTLELWYAVFYQGDQNLISAIRTPNEDLKEVEEKLQEAFNQGDTFEVVKIFENNFGSDTFSIRDLFYDMKLRIMKEIISSFLVDLENSYTQFFDNNATLINFISELQIEFPQSIYSAINSLINRDIIFYLSPETFNIENLTLLFDKAKKLNVILDTQTIAFAVNSLIKTNAEVIKDKVSDTKYIEELITFVNFIKKMPVEIDLWHLQNEVYLLMKNQQYAEDPLFKECASQLDLEVD